MYVVIDSLDLISDRVKILDTKYKTIQKKDVNNIPDIFLLDLSTTTSENDPVVLLYKPLPDNVSFQQAKLAWELLLADNAIVLAIFSLELRPLQIFQLALAWSAPLLKELVLWTANVEQIAVTLPLLSDDDIIQSIAFRDVFCLKSNKKVITSYIRDLRELVPLHDFCTNIIQSLIQLIDFWNENPPADPFCSGCQKYIPPYQSVLTPFSTISFMFCCQSVMHNRCRKSYTGGDCFNCKGAIVEVTQDQPITSLQLAPSLQTSQRTRDFALLRNLTTVFPPTLDSITVSEDNELETDVLERLLE